MKSHTACRIGRIPKPIRTALAVFLICLGFSLFITPFPGGIFLIAIGFVLLYCAWPSMRNRLARRIRKMPGIGSRLRPFLDACDACPTNAKAQPSPSGKSNLSISPIGPNSKPKMPRKGLVPYSAMSLRNADAKRPGMHSHAKRGNESVCERPK